MGFGSNQPVQPAQSPCCLIATGSFAEEAALITSWSTFCCGLFMRQSQMHPWLWNITGTCLETQFHPLWLMLTTQQPQTGEGCSSLLVPSSNNRNVFRNIHNTEPQGEAAALHSFSGLPEPLRASLLLPSQQFLEQGRFHHTGFVLCSVQQAKPGFSFNNYLDLKVTKTSKGTQKGNHKHSQVYRGVSIPDCLFGFVGNFL